MTGRPFFLLPALVLCLAPAAHSANAASGRHWQVAIGSLACSGAVATVGMQIRYLGPRGPVEAPVSRLVDGEDRRYPPSSLVWRGGSKELAQWLSAGGVVNVQPGRAVHVELRFEVRGAAGGLRLEFGDVEAIALAREGMGCAGLLKPDALLAPRAARSARRAAGDFRIYRSAYPCRRAQGGLRTIEAEYPPYLPRQLLLFGRGYLPSAREAELPMGKAPAQSYAYSGLDELDAVDDAARRAVAADFPEHGPGLAARRRFAFNWGMQKTESGNDAYAIGIYDLRDCRESGG